MASSDLTFPQLLACTSHEPWTTLHSSKPSSPGTHYYFKLVTDRATDTYTLLCTDLRRVRVHHVPSADVLQREKERFAATIVVDALDLITNLLRPLPVAERASVTHTMSDEMLTSETVLNGLVKVRWEFAWVEVSALTGAPVEEDADLAFLREAWMLPMARMVDVVGFALAAQKHSSVAYTGSLVDVLGSDAFSVAAASQGINTEQSLEYADASSEPPDHSLYRTLVRDALQTNLRHATQSFESSQERRILLEELHRVVEQELHPPSPRVGKRKHTQDSLESSSMDYASVEDEVEDGNDDDDGGGASSSAAAAAAAASSAEAADNNADGDEEMIDAVESEEERLRREKLKAEKAKRAKRKKKLKKRRFL